MMLLPVVALTVAIIHAKAWTLTEPTPVENATLVMTDGKIISVSSGGSVPDGARVFDAHGRPLTPGLVHPATHLGLLEVSLASDTVDTSTKSTSLGADFDIQYGINANSALVELARADGLTRAISYPGRSGIPPFSGTGALLRLGESGDIVERPGVGVFVVIGNHFAEAGASRAAQWELLRHALDDARKALASTAAPTASTAGASARTAANAVPTAEVLALQPVLAGKIPLAITTQRESDIRQAIRLAKDYSIHVVIIGASEAWRVAGELAAAKIPVIVDPQANLPANFDELGARLDNAELLHKAGVTVATAVLSSIHQSYNAGESLREGAGLAVANGLPYIDALRSITAVPAQIWGLEAHCGTLAPGYDADVVVWDGDPLEPSSAPMAVWVAGKEVSLKTRQTELRDRYMKKDGLTAISRHP